MSATRAQLVRQIAIARRQATALSDAIGYGGAETAKRRRDLALAERASGYVRDLEAVLGDYDRAHPDTGEEPDTGENPLTETDLTEIG